MSNTARAKLYDRLIKRGYQEIGSGYFSVVLAKPGSDKVIKICNTPDRSLDFVIWAAKHGYAGSLAPRVYSYKQYEDGTYTAVMERLGETASKRIRKDPEGDFADKWRAVNRLCYNRN